MFGPRCTTCFCTFVCSSQPKGSPHYGEYNVYSTFQSHEPEFDYLKSLEIEEKINKIRWLRRQNQSHFLLSTNGELWRPEVMLWCGVIVVSCGRLLECCGLDASDFVVFRVICGFISSRNFDLIASNGEHFIHASCLVSGWGDTSDRLVCSRPCENFVHPSRDSYLAI